MKKKGTLLRMVERAENNKNRAKSMHDLILVEDEETNSVSSNDIIASYEALTSQSKSDKEVDVLFQLYLDSQES